MSWSSLSLYLCESHQLLVTVESHNMVPWEKSVKNVSGVDILESNMFFNLIKNLR